MNSRLLRVACAALARARTLAQSEASLDCEGAAMDKDMMATMGFGSDDEEQEYDEEDIVAVLMARIEEKEDQLRMAAEIGQSLLQKNEQLAEQVEELEEERDRLDEELEESRYRVEELEENQSQIHESGAEELEELRLERDNLAQQLRGSQSEAKRAQSTLDGMGVEVEGLREQLGQALLQAQKAATIDELTGQRDSLATQLEITKAELEVKAHEMLDAASRHSRTIEVLEVQVADLQAAATAWTGERAELNAAEARARDQAETAEAHSSQLAMSVSELQTKLATLVAQQSLNHSMGLGEEGIPPDSNSAESLGDEIAAMPEPEPNPMEDDVVQGLLAQKDTALAELLAEKDKLQAENRGLQQRLSSRESELLAEKDKLQAEIRAAQKRLSSRESELLAEKDKLQAEVRAAQKRVSSSTSVAGMRGSASSSRTASPIDREARRSARRKSVSLVRIRDNPSSLSACYKIWCIMGHLADSPDACVGCCRLQMNLRMLWQRTKQGHQVHLVSEPMHRFADRQRDDSRSHWKPTDLRNFRRVCSKHRSRWPQRNLQRMQR